jgi:tRNA(Ile)-lysidine synthase
MPARAALPYSPDALAAALQQLGAPRHLWVALSGGADSAALLVAAAALAGRSFDRLDALHVDHGLPGSPTLRAAAAAAAAHCQVPLTVVTVNLVDRAERGLEAAARQARYAAFAGQMSAQSALLTAHHQEDQAETLLLQILRGAGVRGMAAMPSTACLGLGRLLRPVLEVPRASLRALAEGSGVPWCEDPSNEDRAIDRNYLRHEIWPRLTARWPAAASTLARAAHHAGGTAALLDEVLDARLAGIERDGALNLSALAAVEAPWRQELIRYWLRRQGYPLPSTRRLAQFDAQFLASAADGQPLLTFGEMQLRRHDGWLYAHRPLPPLALPADADLPTNGDVPLPGLGRLTVVPATDAGLRRLNTPYRVGQREGGERWQRDVDGPNRPLKDWLREARVPRWQRDRAVLLWDQGVLAAVVLPAVTWVAAAYRTSRGEAGLRVEWQDAPVALRSSRLR